MAKRFTDTDKWKKPFLKGLPAAYKLLWFYICDDCDHAGIWQVDIEVACLRIGEDVTVEEAIKVLGDKIKVISNGEKWFIPSFIEFQYPSGLNPSNNGHAGVIKLLNKYGLNGQIKPLMSPSQGAQVKDTGIGKRISKRGKGSGENQLSIQEPDTTAALKSEYTELQKSFPEKDIPTVAREIKTFVEAKSPSFAEPYVDAWNVFAQKRGLAQVKTITDGRRDKIRIRTREPAFKFFEILAAAGKNKFYMGDESSWKIDFDYVIDSEKNYVKILEKG